MKMKQRTIQRAVWGTLAACGLLLLLWQGVRADAPLVSHPAHVQVRQMIPSLSDSEAERASGAYIPGVGAFVTLDLLRGPNTMQGQPAHIGVRDWSIYLMQTFGPQLEAVPPDELITISVDFYDFDSTTYQQLVVVSRAADAADPQTYQVWLNGQPYNSAGR
jgi:hypothetical protein